MPDAELVCPQCGLTSRGVARCPECGAPFVPEAALRLTPDRGADESSYAQVVALRDPFEGGLLITLLESRRIPVMIRGGAEAALAAGWVDHRGPRFGELMVPEGRLAEATDLVTAFRAEIDREGSISEDELAEVSAAAEREIEREASQRSGPPGRRLRLPRDLISVFTHLGASLLVFVQAAGGLQSGRFIPAGLFFFLGVMILRRLPPSIVIEAGQRRVKVHTLGRLLLARPPRSYPWSAFSRVVVCLERSGARVVLVGSPPREGGRPLKLQGTLQKPAFANADAARLARFMALPHLPVDAQIEEDPPAKKKR